MRDVKAEMARKIEIVVMEEMVGIMEVMVGIEEMASVGEMVVMVMEEMASVGEMALMGRWSWWQWR